MTTAPHTPHEPKEASLQEEIFQRIDNEAIAPAPRWQFLLKDWTLWGAFALACSVGMLAVAAALFVFQNSGFRFYAATHDNVLTFFFEMVPIMWLGALGVFTAVAYYNFRHTKNGYRYPLLAIIAFSILLSIAGGSAMHTLGFGHELEEKIGAYVPFSQPVTLMQKDWWVKPERGLLAGEVIAVATTSKTFTLQAFDGTLWEIATDDLREPDFMTLQNIDLVRVVGVPTETATTSSEVVFHACFLFPWDLPPPPQFLDDKRQSPFRHGRMAALERQGSDERSIECRGIRPFQKLRDLQESDD